jgi:hypothetical protein
MPEPRQFVDDLDVADETVVIHVQLTLAAESLTGWARDDIGAERGFGGRVGLLAAIDALIASPGGGTSSREGT